MREGWAEVDVRDHGYQIITHESELAGKVVKEVHHISYEGHRLIFLLEAGDTKYYAVFNPEFEVVYDPRLWIVLANSYGIITQEQYNEYHAESKAEREHFELEQARSQYKRLLNRFGDKLK